jgi:hypothetical protein
MKERATYDEALRLFTSIKVDQRHQEPRNGMTDAERELLVFLAEAVIAIAWGKLIAEDVDALETLLDRVEAKMTQPDA